jgi:hypothetical protein
MKTILPLLFFGVLAGSCLVGAAGKLPALTAERWVNSAPLTAAGLRGKVVLVDVWEYTCINWIRTLPYVQAWNRGYASLGLVVIGVHSPEFEFGKRAENIDRGIRDHDAARRRHVLTLVTSDPGVRAFAFTFGPYSEHARSLVLSSTPLLKRGVSRDDTPGVSHSTVHEGYTRERP